MTDRHAGYVVALERDMREDDAQVILDAIRLIRGVCSVEPVEGGYSIAIAEARARREIEERLWKALREVSRG